MPPQLSERGAQVPPAPLRVAPAPLPRAQDAHWLLRRACDPAGCPSLGLRVFSPTAAGCNTSQLSYSPLPRPALGDTQGSALPVKPPGPLGGRHLWPTKPHRLSSTHSKAAAPPVPGALAFLRPVTAPGTLLGLCPACPSLGGPPGFPPSAPSANTPFEEATQTEHPVQRPVPTWPEACLAWELP